MVSPSASPLRQLLEERWSQLLSDAEQWAGEARRRAARDSMERMNQAVRRIRQAGDLSELSATLVDTAAGFASGAALFLAEGETARLENVRGGPDEEALEPLREGVPLAEAPAIRNAVESRDPVIAAAIPGEVSAAIAGVLGHCPDDRVFILPIVSHDRVHAVLYAWGDQERPALELLAQVGAATWSGREPALPAILASVPLVTIRPSPGSWDSLPREEQRVHLGAQRFARVKVAEIRLAHSEDVSAGRASRSLYAVLREPIDNAREAFRQRFFERCPSMVDYFHLELVRTLAHDDAELLGQDYPGPLL